MAIAFIVRDASNTPRTVTGWLPRDDANVQQTTEAAFDRTTGNVSELFFNPSGSGSLSVSASSPVHGISSGSGTATTNICTATPTGGTAPYTYLWELIPLSSDAPVDPTADSPTSASTRFTQTSMDPSGVYTSTFKVTVTDNNGTQAVTTVTANFADAS